MGSMIDRKRGDTPVSDKASVIREIEGQGVVHLHAQGAGPRLHNGEPALRWCLVLFPQHDRICRDEKRCIIVRL